MTTVTTQAPEDLAALGWSSRSWDTCWLECSEEGFARVVHGKVICLCAPHARLLEAGRFHGEYKGAALPPFTMLPDWPWRDVDTMDGDVPEDALAADPDPRS